MMSKLTLEDERVAASLDINGDELMEVIWSLLQEDDPAACASGAISVIRESNGSIAAFVGIKFKKGYMNQLAPLIIERAKQMRSSQ